MGDVLDITGMIQRRRIEPSGDAFIAGQHARGLIRSAVNAMVTCKWHRRRGKYAKANLSLSEARTWRLNYHRMLRTWGDCPGFWAGYDSDTPKGAA